MSRRPTIPCTRCGVLLWPGATCRADAERVCRACRHAERVRPEIGQLWESTDPRSPGRRMRIIDIDWADGAAVVRLTSPGEGDSPMHVGTTRTVRLERLRPGARGYRLAGLS